MSEMLPGFLIFLVLFVFLAAGVHIAVVMSLVGFVALLLISPKMALVVMQRVPFQHAYSFTLTIIPLFIIMGDFASHAGATTALYAVAAKWVGHLKGGLAMATVLASGAFGAMCASSVAAAAVFGRVTIPEMERLGYHPRLAAGCVAAGGTLDMLIPPSAIMVVFAWVTETSVAKLLIAGILPGVLLTMAYAVMINIWVTLSPKMAPQLSQRYSWRERITGLKSAWMLPVVAVIILGGIYTGVFTATESGAVGALATFLLFILSRGRSWKKLGDSLLVSGKASCMILFIIIGAFIFSTALQKVGFSSAFITWVVGFNVSRIFVLIAFLVLYIFLGMFMEAIAMLVLTLPIMFPIVLALGFDPVWFGIVVVMMVELGLITPPVGMNVFTVKAVAPHIPLEEIYAGALPFAMVDLVVVGLIIAFPQIALFLPGLMH